jgi:lactam utilization protein B
MFASTRLRNDISHDQTIATQCVRLRKKNYGAITGTLGRVTVHGGCVHSDNELHTGYVFRTRALAQS